jgi:CheY-like chemotaxis protein
MDRAVGRLMGDDVEIVTRLAPDLMTVRVDPSSIEQVLLNLAVNARNAMPDGGRLTIETCNIEVQALQVDTYAAMPPGRYVMLCVSDTGPELDEATRAHIFEPFFTTSEEGKSFGLGLATVYGIVKQSGGYIWVFSESGQGTSFKVYLPPMAAPVRAGKGQNGSDADRRGTETVLLVEDQDAVRTLAREVLRRRGYVVIEARHGLDALRLAERHPDPVHMLVTDVAMPYMNGYDLADRLTAGRPDLKVLFLTNHFQRDAADDRRPGSGFLQKPFTPEALARKVRRMLDAPKDSRMLS